MVAIVLFRSQNMQIVRFGIDVSEKAEMVEFFDETPDY